MVYHRESSGDTNVGTAGSMDGSAAQTGRYSWIKRPKKKPEPVITGSGCLAKRPTE